MEFQKLNSFIYFPIQNWFKVMFNKRAAVFYRVYYHEPKELLGLYTM